MWLSQIVVVVPLRLMLGKAGFPSAGLLCAGYTSHMNLIAKSALTSALILLLSACGNSGPLILPEEPVVLEDAANPETPSEEKVTPPASGVTSPTPEEQEADKQAAEAIQLGSPD